MSFTAEVKDELSRIEPISDEVARAELSALLRVCGTLSFHGTGRYSLKVQTETGAVARAVVQLTHRYVGLETSLTVRRSVQRKTRNYLIEIVDDGRLTEELVRLGILVPGRGLAPGVQAELVDTPETARAFVRGAFMAAGFVADPRGDFHLEIAVTGERFAHDIADLVDSMGVHGRLNHRRGAYAVYLKSYEDVKRVLTVMGAERCAESVERYRKLKSVKNQVNRKVNAELANERRASRSGADQLHLVRRVEAEIGLDALPQALREFCELRELNPEMSLADLGAKCHPVASKSAMYHRVLRLQRLLREAEAVKVTSAQAEVAEEGVADAAAETVEA